MQKLKSSCARNSELGVLQSRKNAGETCDLLSVPLKADMRHAYGSGACPGTGCEMHTARRGKEQDELSALKRRTSNANVRQHCRHHIRTLLVGAPQS